ncbi:MAG: cyanophycinase [Pirellulaceae bacterium]|nr:cyanophycinase [Pirellulaceae bacterium]
MQRTLVFSLLMLSMVSISLTNSPVSAQEPPAEFKGTLFLCGGGRLSTDLYNQFVEYGKSDSLVVIPSPTQRKLSDSQQSGIVERWKKHGFKTVTVLNASNKEEANSADFVKPLKTATAVWFMPGTPGNIADRYVGTLTEAEVKKLLERDGVVGGSSAGCSIPSEFMFRGAMASHGTTDGLGLLPHFIIDQHFIKRKRIGRLTDLLKTNQHLIGVGVCEDTALVVQKDQLSVEGIATVTVCIPDYQEESGSTFVLKPKESYSLSKLQAIAKARIKKMAGEFGYRDFSNPR